MMTDTEQITVEEYQDGALVASRTETRQLSPEEVKRRATIAGYTTAARAVLVASTTAQMSTAMKGYVRATTNVLRLLDSRMTDGE